MDFFQYPAIPKMRSKSLKFKATVFSEVSLGEKW